MLGVPDPEKASLVVEMFERYATGAYSDMQIAEWLNAQGYRTNRDLSWLHASSISYFGILDADVVRAKAISI